VTIGLCFSARVIIHILHGLDLTTQSWVVYNFPVVKMPPLSKEHSWTLGGLGKQRNDQPSKPAYPKNIHVFCKGCAHHCCIQRGFCFQLPVPIFKSAKAEVSLKIL